MFVCWEPISEETVLTPKEQYTTIFSEVLASDKKSAPLQEEVSTGKKRPLSSRASSLSTWYHRIPITDEQPPTPAALDSIIEAFEGAQSSKTVTIFNCQMGRGRTSTGMVIACLWSLHCKNEQDSRSKKLTSLKRMRKSSRDSSLESVVGTPETDDSAKGQEALRSGWWKLIKSLVRLIKNGLKRKEEVDLIVDNCSGLFRVAYFKPDTYAPTTTKTPARMKFSECSL